MSAFAIAIIRETRFGSDIRQYLERIDATLQPFSGRYRVHGGPYQVLEGSWSSDIVIIEFPTLELAEAWYRSPPYQAIIGLRTRNTEGELFLVPGTPESHRATDILRVG